MAAHSCVLSSNLCHCLCHYEKTHLASRRRAITPAPSGAEADVPVCFVVHVLFRSVVVCKNMNHHQNIKTKTRELSYAGKDLFVTHFSWKCIHYTHFRWNASWNEIWNAMKMCTFYLYFTSNVHISRISVPNLYISNICRFRFRLITR